MSVLISGTLIDGAGIPMRDYHIILRSMMNSQHVLYGVESHTMTNQKGEYSIDAQSGKYRVSISPSCGREINVGEIVVYADSLSGTLNDFLLALNEDDLTPDVIKRFEEMVAQAQQSAEAAAGSAQEAGQHATDAEQVKEHVEALAEKVQGNVNAVAETEETVKQLAATVAENTTQVQQGVQVVTGAVTAAEKAAEHAASSAGESKVSADNAAQSEQNAKSYADSSAQNAQKTAQDVATTAASCNDAERFANESKESATAAAASQTDAAESARQSSTSAQASANSADDAAASAESAKQSKDEAHSVLGASLKIANNLSEISDNGLKAQQSARDNLGLKIAATMEPQTDIYDSTEGRLALPGAFGFGAILRKCEYFSTDKGPTEFLNWVKKTPPGRYVVTQYEGGRYNPILEGVVFSGIVEIIIPANVASNVTQQIMGKVLIFYGLNGEIYSNHLYLNSIGGDSLVGWRNLALDAQGVADILRSIGGKANGYAYPDIGGLVFAAYCGSSDSDSGRKIWWGAAVAGSCLAAVTVHATCPSGSIPYTSTPMIAVAPLSLCPMAGTFVALSGVPTTSGGDTSAEVGLFVRIA
ncbi:prophage tail fiber N-terminal domain-containing protein [Hafnia alvei]|uniref:prophage tail fiber N-terminal domain-containing protein n=1 Tax=Hafnia alvei TaxID=569 RepID=UPI001412EEB5|nr:prophage tail fiber N-terminal domain-containing protein [Hafnia alvei]